MKLSEDIKRGLSDAYNAEMLASAMYRTFSIGCEHGGHYEAAEFFEKQAKEEWYHSEKVRKFMMRHGCMPIVEDVHVQWQPSEVNLIGCVDEALKYEKEVWEKYVSLAEMAIVDYPPMVNFALGFIEIQEDEVAMYQKMARMKTTYESRDVSVKEIEEMMHEILEGNPCKH